MIKNMQKITHLDELKYNIFIDIVSLLIIGEYESSEKIDGENFSFGLDIDDKLYTKSKKSNPVFNSDFYSKIDFMKKFQKIHDNINIDKLKKIKKIILFKSKEKSNLQFFGELLEQSHTNTISYTIDKPTLIIFDLFLNDKNITTKNVIANIMKRHLSDVLSDYNVKLKFLYPSKPIELYHFDLFKDIYNKHKNIIESRKKKDKQLKIKVKNILDVLKLNIKNQIINQTIRQYKSHLNKNIEPEGIIIRNDKLITKIVDKEIFTKINSKNHLFSDKIKSIFIKYKKEIIKEVFNNSDVLLDVNKQIQKSNDYCLSLLNKDENHIMSEMDIITSIYLDIIEENNYKDESFLIYKKIHNKYYLEFIELKNEWINKDKTLLSENQIKIIDNQYKYYNEILKKQSDVYDIIKGIVNINKIIIYL